MKPEIAHQQLIKLSTTSTINTNQLTANYRDEHIPAWWPMSLLTSSPAYKFLVHDWIYTCMSLLQSLQISLFYIHKTHPLPMHIPRICDYDIVITNKPHFNIARNHPYNLSSIYTNHGSIILNTQKSGYLLIPGIIIYFSNQLFIKLKCTC